MNEILIVSKPMLLLWVEKYSDMIYRIALHNTKHREDAEDVIQETFIRLMNQNQFDSEEHLKAWLIRVTINLCKSLHSKRKRFQTTQLTTVSVPFNDNQQRLFDQIRKLPVNYRNVMYLFYFEGYQLAEIAKLLNSNEKTISSQLSRARKKLKKLLEDGDY